MEKKIRIDVEIAGAVENLEKVNAAFEEATGTAKTMSKSLTEGVRQQGDAVAQQNEKIQKLLHEEMQDLQELKRRRAAAWSKKEIADYDKRIQETGQRIKSMGGTFDELKSVALMSLGEMKKELRELRNMSFTGMAEEEIQAVKQRMAELTDAIGDFQGQIRSASNDTIPALVTGFQGIISGVQLVTGALQIFGIENEKLEKSIVALIGVSQALSQIQAAVQMGHFQNAKAAAVAMAAKIKLTLATTALGKAMLALPIGWIIAGIAALVAGVALAVNAFKSKSSAIDELQEKYEDMFDEGLNVVAQMEINAYAMRSAERGTKEYTKAVEAYNKKAKEQKLFLIDVNASLEEQNRIMRENQKLIMARVAMQAAEEELLVLMKEKFKLERAYAEAKGKYWDWSLMRFMDEKAMVAEQINANQEQINSIMLLYTQLGNWVDGMEAVITKQHALKEATEDNNENLDVQTKKINEQTSRTDKQTRSVNNNTLAIRQNRGERIELMKAIDATMTMQQELDTMIANMATIPLEAKSAWTDYYKSQQEMSRETALMLINDVNATMEARIAAQQRLQELDEEDLRRKLENISTYNDMVKHVGNTAIAIAEAMASGAEQGSEREKNARKLAAIAAITISSAQAAANIAEAITKAQALGFPLSIAETIRIAAVGVSQIAAIIAAKNEISKLALGGRGEFRGASHAAGGIMWNGYEVEGGEKWYVLSKAHSRKYGHIMDKVFDEIKAGRVPATANNPIYAPTINLNDKYTRGMYELMKQPQQLVGDRYREIKQGNRITRIYR